MSDHYRKQIGRAHADAKQIARFAESTDEPLVAIFDLGTRAARLLVAPSRVPLNWGKATFANSSIIANLGSSINDQSLISENDKSLQLVIQFIRIHTKNLKRLGVRNISVLGTAVFRWLEHEPSMIAFLNEQSGIELQIVPDHLEARLTLQALPDIFARTGCGPNISDDDTVMLVDQGGGSLEISWMKWSDRTRSFPTVHSRTLQALGTVALRNNFFNRSADGKLVKPEHNRARISQQVVRVRTAAENDIAGESRGIPRHAPDDGRRLHLVGVGTGITNVFGSKWSTRQIHGRVVGLDKIEHRLAQSQEGMDATNQQVMSVFRGMNNMKGRGAEKWAKFPKLDTELALLYGLPVYQQVMRQCGVNEITINGYGLRYGYYIDRFFKHFVDPDCSGPYCFVSYSHINPQDVYDDLYELESKGIRFWYDRGIKVSKSWTETLAEKVDQCAEMMVFLTPHSIRSDEVYREVHQHTRQNGRKVIPVLSGVEFKDIPPKLKSCISDTQCLSRDHHSDYIGELETVLVSCRRAK